MTHAVHEDGGAPLSSHSPFRITRWAVWSLPAHLLGSVLVVEVLAVVLLVVDVLRGGVAQFSGHSLAVVGALAAVGVVHTEFALGAERARRRVTPSPHVDLSSVWTFAAALLLPPLLAGAVVVVLYIQQFLRIGRAIRRPLHRFTYSAATVVLAVHAAAGAVGYVGQVTLFGSAAGLGAIAVALLCYTAVNTSLVVGVFVVSTPDARLRHMLDKGDEVVLELATLAMGALAAGAIASSSPLHVVLVLPPLVVLHRAVLVRHLQEVASTDGKTGLLNADAWRDRAARVLERAQRIPASAALLILDLDHFKQVNDSHGHLAGDRVLSAVAAALRAEVRDNDLVGRFGGEEFVIMLPGLDAEYDRAELVAVADRIRRRIHELGVEVATPAGPLTVSEVSVSVGGATYPSDAVDLDRLLEVADSALYAAKRAGRNAVRVGLHLHPAGSQTSRASGNGPGPTALP